MRSVAPLFAVLCSAACWPTIVRSSPDEPLFRSGFPLIGALRTDGAICSLASVGGDTTLLASAPESAGAAIPVGDACAGPAIPASAHGRLAEMVAVETSLGPARGYLYRLSNANGLVVLFTGLGMPAAGWINERFAETAARRGLATFALVRDEAARPIYFDPLREARRAIEAAGRVRSACRLESPRPLGLVGISLGGFEALLANREALAAGLDSRAAVLDPLLDPDLAAENLDSSWHSMGVSSMQDFFHRILAGRYGEKPTVAFRDVIHRVSDHPEAQTSLSRDTATAWLCDAQRDRFVIFLSDTDPVLGDAQRSFLRDCSFPTLPAGAPGHVPLACRLELFEEMISAVAPPLTLARRHP